MTSFPDSDRLRRRLWRARRQHHHIDALLVARGEEWELVFLHDDQVLVTWPFARRDLAVAEADRRLSELVQAGWNAHW